jgi:hypothetical protein
MFHLDNSEFSWLVYADWLEDQDIDATHIRSLVVEPTTNDWCYEYYTLINRRNNGRIGGGTDNEDHNFSRVGSNELDVGYGGDYSRVGGNNISTDCAGVGSDGSN